MPNALTQTPAYQGLRDRIALPAVRRAQGLRAWVVEHDPVYTGFRRPRRPEKIAATVSLVLIAAVVVFLALFDWNWLRGPIGRWASARYEREIQLNGDLDVDIFSWTPSARVRDVRIGGPDWAREKDTLRIQDAVASVRLRKLFSGQLELPLVSIVRPEAVLIADAQGRKSWMLNPDKPDDGGTNFPPINRLIIRDGHVSFSDAKRDLSLDATVTAREGTDGQAGFRLEGRGSLNRTPLSLTIVGGPFINVRRDQPYRFEARLAGVNSTLKADGAITRPFDLGRFNADLTLQGRDLSDLYLLTGLTLPNTPPYRIAGKLTRQDEVFTFNDFSGRVGSSDLSGDLKVFKQNDRRRVEADLRSRLLDLDDLATVLGARPTVTSAGNTVASSGRAGKLLPDAPLAVDRLRVMDGTLTYKAARVKRNTFDVRQVDLGARLQRGVLNLDPIAFTFNRGELRGTAKIDAAKGAPYSTVDLRLRGYPLESIIPARNGAPTVTGRALGRAQLQGPGASIHDFAARSKGRLSLVVPQGQIRAAFAELLGINAGAGLSKLLSGDQTSTPINCAVADFSVSGGVASVRSLVVDTDVVISKGSGAINLGAETMNLKLDGESKKPRLLHLWSPILVRGPLTAPTVGVETSSVVAQGGLAAALGALVSPLAAILPFVTAGGAEDANCGALVSAAR